MGWPRLTFPQGRGGKADPMRIFSAEGRFALMLSPDFFKGFSMDISLPDAESTVEFGRQLGRALNEQYAEGGEQVHIILFYGDLAQARPRSHAASSKRCPEENAEVSSPSFTLCNSYPTTPPSSIAICTARRAHCPMKWTRRWIRNPDWCSSNGPSGLQPRICPRNVWTSCFKSAKITGW